MSSITLRKVAWCNAWNYSSALDSDGVGSKAHLTSADGVIGKTLCGKEFPADKGHPSTAGFCKRCVNKAYKMGYVQGFTRQLVWVQDSTESMAFAMHETV